MMLMLRLGMESRGPDQVVVYLAILVSLIVLHRVYNKLSARSFLARAIRRVIFFAIATTIASVIFFWRVRSINGGLATSEAWTTALDIAFAHIVLTLPVFLLLMSISTEWSLIELSILLTALVIGIVPFTIYLVFLFIAKMWAIAFELLFDHPVAYDEFQSDINTGLEPALWVFVVIVAVVGGVLPSATALWLMWLFFMATSNLQTFLFGAFDASLGWFLPTTFRFTVLFNHVKSIIEALSKNEVIATVVSFSGFVVAIILGIGALAEAVNNIGHAVKTSRRNAGPGSRHSGQSGISMIADLARAVLNNMKDKNETRESGDEPV